MIVTVEIHSDGRGRFFAALADGTIAGTWCRTAEAAFAAFGETAREWVEVQGQRPWKQLVEEEAVERFVQLQRVFGR